MNIKDLIPAILLITSVGMLIGVGVVTLDQMGDVVREEHSTTENGVQLWTHNWTTLTNSNLDSVTSLYNSSNAADLTAYATLDQTGKYESTKVKLVTTAPKSANGTLQNITYVWGGAGAATTAVHLARDGTDDFVTWIPVIVVICAAAIILGLVMSSFRKN